MPRGGVRTLFHNGNEVASVDIKTALTNFIEWLETFESSVNLIAHNCQTFDMRHLLHSILSCNLGERFRDVVQGFGDTKPYLQKAMPGMKSYSVEALYKSNFQNANYDCHNAVADVKVLKSLLELCHSHSLSNFTWSLESVEREVSWSDNMNSLLPSLAPLYSPSPNVVSKSMCKKIAGSGLAYKHLKCVFDRDGPEGLIILLTSKSSNKIRVTKSEKILNKIVEHFS
jgi:DNA polymerase III alpha subunit (gram-positive type)